MQPARQAAEVFPAIPLDSWRPTKETLHRYAQILGKLLLAHSAPTNHWWNVALRVTARGLTTGPMPASLRSRHRGAEPGARREHDIFGVDLDLVDHRAHVDSTSGQRVSFSLDGLVVADFHAGIEQALAQLGITMGIDPAPFDLAGSPPLDQDREHATYDRDHANRYWRVLGQVATLLEDYAGRSYAKTSPVNHYWHTFDIAVGRYAARRVPVPPTADAVTVRAYSHEVISCGFWFGDDTTPFPAFYCYIAPEPDGLAEEPLQPQTARWVPSRGAHLALLRYDDARATTNPRETVLNFYESAYTAGARRAGWDVEGLRCDEPNP